MHPISRSGTTGHQPVSASNSNSNSSPTKARTSPLAQALDARELAALRGPALERGIELRKALVHELLKRLQPHKRDQALALAKDPTTLPDAASGLDAAIRLRKVMLEAYFETASSSAAATTTARTELAAALDTTGLAGQPADLVAKAALLRLALAAVAQQRGYANQEPGQPERDRYSYPMASSNSYAYYCAPSSSRQFSSYNYLPGSSSTSAPGVLSSYNSYYNLGHATHSASSDVHASSSSAPRPLPGASSINTTISSSSSSAATKAAPPATRPGQLPR